MLKKYFLEFVLGVIFALTTAISVIDFFSDERHVKYKIILILVLLIIYGIVFVVKLLKNKNKTLKEGSSEFFNYFTRWYSQHGKLSIFCSDLDWMINGPHDLINTICKKGHDCSVYLREEIKPGIEHRLKDAGVQIFPVTELLTRHRFSLLENDNSVSLIIGDKRNKSDDIEFKEETSVSNPYMITVVQDLLGQINNHEK